MSTSTLPSMALRVSDLDRTLSFCVDVLGFAYTPSGSAEAATVVDLEGDPLLLAGPAATDVSALLTPRHAVFDHGETLVFRHQDVASFQRDLEERGADDLALTTTSWGDSTLAVVLPDGYQFKFADKADLSDNQVLDLYARGPALLDAALKGTTVDDLDLRDHLDWSVRMLVHHICDGDVLWSGALFAALVQSGTDYSHDWYTTDPHCAEQLSYDGRDIETALALFRTSRAHQVRMLNEVPDALGRSISLKRRYEETGTPMEVREILRRRAVHSLEHVDEVVRLVGGQ